MSHWTKFAKRGATGLARLVGTIVALLVEPPVAVVVMDLVQSVAGPMLDPSGRSGASKPYVLVGQRGDDAVTNGSVRGRSRWTAGIDVGPPLPPPRLRP